MKYSITEVNVIAYPGQVNVSIRSDDFFAYPETFVNCSGELWV